MKNLKTLLLVVMIMVSSILSASTNPKETDVSASMRAEIVKLLKNPDFKMDKKNFAKVKLAINQDNEIVVLYVDTNNKSFESYVKRRLNYKKISEETVSETKMYIIPVTVVKS